MKFFAMTKPAKTTTICWTTQKNITPITIDTIEDGWHPKLMFALY